MNDIDDEIVEHFKKLAAQKNRINADIFNEPKEILMEKLHLTNSGYLTNAAMLLFSKDPEKWLLGAYTKIGFFENDADLLYQDEIHGSLLEQVDKIIEVAHLKYMKARITYKNMRRVEQYFVPYDALREALLNALCHKAYSRGIPIQVSVYEDRLYIANCGRLPENWDTKKLMGKHSSEPFNPNIAHIFYLAGFIESWGRGIEKICSACRDDGVPMPEYDITGGSIMVKFTAPKDRIVRPFTNTATEKVTERVTEKVTEKELSVLNLLMEDPGYTTTELSAKLGVSRKTISSHIRNLKNKGLICRVGSDKKGYWEITPQYNNS